MGFPELPVVLVSPSLEGGVSQSLITVPPPPQLARTRRGETGAVPAPVAAPQPWPGAQAAPWHPPKRHPPPCCPPTCRPSTRLAVTCWAPVWSASEWLCPQRPKPRQTPLEDTGTPRGTHWALDASPAPGLVLGCHSCWVPLWRIWEGFLVLPRAPSTAGSLLAAAPLTVTSVLGQPGHPGAAGRGVAAAAAAGGEPAPLPQLSRGKSRSPCHPGQEAAADQRNIVPPRRSTLGVGGGGAARGHPQPQPVPSSAVRGLPACCAEVVAAFLSSLQGPEPSGAGQSGPRGHSPAEGEVSIAVPGQAGAGPR